MEAGGKDYLGKIREEMRNLMTEKVGVFRTEQGMDDAIEELRELKERADKTLLASRSLIMNQDLIHMAY
jgi:succinate dehydrogenase / fumarate reductase, flavoprotein subunit